MQTHRPSQHNNPVVDFRSCPNLPPRTLRVAALQPVLHTTPAWCPSNVGLRPIGRSSATPQLLSHHADALKNPRECSVFSFSGFWHLNDFLICRVSFGSSLCIPATSNCEMVSDPKFTNKLCVHKSITMTWVESLFLLVNPHTFPC